MPATATARRVAASPARRATASRPALKPRPKPSRSPRRRTTAHRRATAPARRRRSQVTPVAGFVPLAVGRTAGAVGGLADSGLVVRLTRSRLWIVLLGALLVGIVALNVWALSLSASSSRIAAQTDGLKRANSALQARIAGELSNEQVQAVAAELGLAMPEPGAIRYRKAGDEHAALAAKRLERGDFAAASTVAPVVAEPVVVEETTTAIAPTDPTVIPPAPPTATTVAPTATAGGVGAP
jgi:hypothetical protein